MKRELRIARMSIHGVDARVTVYYEDSHPVEVYCESIFRPSLLGNIYIGIVEQDLPRYNGAFVRISPEQQVYLPHPNGGPTWKTGDRIAIQICQEAQKTKLPKAQTVWELPGETLVLSSGNPGLSFSKRLSREQRAELTSLLPKELTSTFHVLFRTRAGESTPEAIRAEATALAEILQEIHAREKDRTAYTCLYAAPGLQETILHRAAPESWSRIQTDDPDVRAALSASPYARMVPVEFYEDPQLALYRLLDLSALLDHLTRKNVSLPSGASLILEQTEAFAAIDVNTAGVQGKKTAKETIRRVNREAALEAARQIRLRQLSGTILIDFINPSDPAEEKELADLLQDALDKDPVPSKVVDFTRLHICEVTRRKRMRPLAEQLRALPEAANPFDKTVQL